MTHRQPSRIHRALTTALPRRRIRDLARRLGVVRRRRKVDIVALVYTLVLGFSAGNRRSLTDLRRRYLRATGVRLAPSSFHARFNLTLVELMRKLTLEALEQCAPRRPALVRAQRLRPRRKYPARHGVIAGPRGPDHRGRV